MPFDKITQRGYCREYYINNRDKIRQAQKDWRNSPAGAEHRFNKTLRKHGISRAEWDAMWQNQNGNCAGCLEPLVIGARTHIDHCHDSGIVRGLLCSSCNLAIGKIKDRPTTLRRLAAYLERSLIREVA